MFLDFNVVWWYLLLFLLGIIFFPATRLIFGGFFYDFGYPFTKAIAILALSFTIYVLGTLKLLPFSQEALFLLIVLYSLVNIYILVKSKKNWILLPFTKKRLLLIAAEEVAFFVALTFWAYVRGQEASIRGLEKFMDFGFINSILRTKYFPPPDMWLSGNSINYYYFGHLTGALLTKISAIPSNITYNLILATIFALSITESFSLSFNLAYNAFFKKIKFAVLGGLLGTFLVNLAGNLHTIYTFTTGYPNEKPIPFWQILSKYTPEKYWYPNATRFIAYTIHEFPIYSYVVADLHGHVFDIPFVLLTLAVLLILVLRQTNKDIKHEDPKKFSIFNFQFSISIFLGFLTAVHYMTNAFDGPIYMLLSIFILFVILGLTRNFFINIISLLISFAIFTLPFSINFTPFVSGIGVNCAPEFLTSIKKLGPFLFEKGNCQTSPFWMLIVLWGFFWLNFIFIAGKIISNKKTSSPKEIKNLNYDMTTVVFVLVLFLFSTVLVIIPEFFYIKDIYPGHFRANTMFKLGYQAFIMMAVSSSFVFIFFTALKKIDTIFSRIYFIFFIPAFFLVALYPSFAINSYYGKLDRRANLDGSVWILTQYPEYKEIIDFLNREVSGQPTILEAQGDSYTDFNVVSSYTGLPTVAGWFVHQWLWRGNPSYVSERVPYIQNIYESQNLDSIKKNLRKFNVKYIIVGRNEKQKYKNLKEDKFHKIGRLIFTSSDGEGKIFQITP